MSCRNAKYIAAMQREKRRMSRKGKQNTGRQPRQRACLCVCVSIHLSHARESEAIESIVILSTAMKRVRSSLIRSIDLFS